MDEHEHDHDNNHDHDHEHEHEHEDSCTPSDGNNMGLAFGLTIGAGFATNVGALLSFLPCFKRSNVTLLVVGLALAAGFMVYISFVEILGKSGEYFHCHTEDHATLAATGCFFLGILLTILLQYFLDSLQRLDVGCTPPWSKKKAMDGELKEEQDEKKYSSMMKSLKSKLMGESSDRDKEEKTIGVPNITAVESKRSGETKFDSTAAESEIVGITDENSDEVSIFTIIMHKTMVTVMH